jgi:hypothetical protein
MLPMPLMSSAAKSLSFTLQVSQYNILAANLANNLRVGGISCLSYVSKIKVYKVIEALCLDAVAPCLYVHVPCF